MFLFIKIEPRLKRKCPMDDDDDDDGGGGDKNKVKQKSKINNRTVRY